MGQAPKTKRAPQGPRAADAEVTSAPAATSADRGGESLIFKVAGERLALPARDVAEIIRPRAVTRVPHGPPSLIGVTNLRGTVLPIISLARLLGHDAAAPSPGARIVVMATGAAVGLLVDEISALTPASDERRIDLEALLAQDFAALSRRRPGDRAPVSHTPAVGNPERDDLALIGFTVAGQTYALPLDKVAEVVPLPATVAAVPDTDDAMMGVISLRGHLLPLVSLRVVLGLQAEGFDATKARVVVTRMGTSLVGLVADHMTAIIRVSEDALDPVPLVLTRGQGEARIEAICRLDNGARLIAILSPARLFDDVTATRIFAGVQNGTTTMPIDNDHAASEQFVVFQLADEQYGLPIAAVDEVVRCPDSLTRVPRAPAFIAGVMNLRGKIVPIIDQRQRFAASGEGTRGRRVIVVTIDGVRAGFVVDAVSEVLTIAARELVAAPDLTADGTRIFDRIATIERDGRMILLIDPKALLDRAERDVLAALAADTPCDDMANA